MRLKTSNRGTRLVKVEASKEDVKIVLPEGIAVIDTGAFLLCDNVKEVVLPESLVSINVGAFSDCESLENVELPNSLERIGSKAFEWCVSLRRIEIPNNVQSIEDDVFMHCKNLESVKLSSSLERIGAQVFYMCKNLERIEIPQGVEAIGYDCFYKCENLKDVVIPDSVKEIGENCFDGCENVESLLLGDFYLLKEDNLWDLIDGMKSFYINEETGEILALSKDVEQVKGYRKLEYEKLREQTDKYVYWKSDTIVLSAMFDDNDLKRLRSLQYLFPLVTIMINKNNYKMIGDMFKNNSREFSNLVKRLEKQCLINFELIYLDVFKLACSLGAFSNNQIERQRACEFISNIFGKGLFDYRTFHGSFESLNLVFAYNKECAEFLMNKNNFAKLVNLEKNESGYIARVIDSFDDIKEFGRSNRGNQRYRKVTVEMCKQYMSMVNFKGVDESNEDIAETISKYTRNQDSFDEAVELRKKYLAQKDIGKVKDHILEEGLFSFVDEERKVLLSDASEVLGVLNSVANECFTYEFLSKYDPRNFVLGKYCSCCAHLEGAGYGIMKASILHPDCQNLVIKDKQGTIVAKSTLYVNRSQGYGVFNNVEINNNLVHNKDIREKIYKKYMEAVDAFARKYNEKNPSNPVRQINVGMNLNDLEAELIFNNKHSDVILSGIDFSSFGGYAGDWQESQYVVWNNKSESKKK